MSQTDQNVKQQIRPEQTAKHEVITEQTTKPEIRSEPSQDFFVTYKQNVERYFENVENSIPKYYQTLLELQQEYLQAWENMFKATITVQKEFVSKTGLNLEQSTIASKIVVDTTEAAIKARTVRDQILLTTIDTTKDNLKEWNNRIPDFADLNRKIMQYWISAFTTRKN
jgi:membrane-associated HD superfamily phosphohydrolase